MRTFHLELFSELQFLVFVALPYIIPAVNGDRKFFATTDDDPGRRLGVALERVPRSRADRFLATPTGDFFGELGRETRYRVRIMPSRGLITEIRASLGDPARR